MSLIAPVVLTSLGPPRLYVFANAFLVPGFGHCGHHFLVLAAVWSVHTTGPVQPTVACHRGGLPWFDPVCCALRYTGTVPTAFDWNFEWSCQAVFYDIFLSEMMVN